MKHVYVSADIAAALQKTEINLVEKRESKTPAFANICFGLQHAKSE